MKTILKSILFTLIFVSNLSAFADESTESKGKPNPAAVLADAPSVRSIIPIFGQLISYSLPKGFVPVFEDVKPNFYIWEAVLSGESVQNWSQMITVTGFKDLALNSKVNQEIIVANIAGGFQKACPNTFNAAKFELNQLMPGNNFAAVLSCGTSNPTGPQYSETTLVIAMKGDKNYYTVQWAEKGTASPAKVSIDDAKWLNRLRMLNPIKLCPVIPDEKAPYLSCK